MYISVVPGQACETASVRWQQWLVAAPTLAVMVPFRHGSERPSEPNEYMARTRIATLPTLQHETEDHRLEGISSYPLTAVLGQFVYGVLFRERHLQVQAASVKSR